MLSDPERAKNHLGEAEPFFPVSFDPRELHELWGEEGGGETCVTVDHVTNRDIRLVDQADLVVCYRPYWGGRISGGVGTEVRHANEAGKPVYAYVGGDVKGAKPLEGNFTQQFVDLDKFWKFLQQESDRRHAVPRPAYY
jgi:hypothetical protein